jgi:hypothetical protein
MGWPFNNVTSSVVGWATLDPTLLEGSTDGIDVYTTKDSQGVAECDPGCGRYFHHDNDYVACPGGADRHYDMSLWLTEGLGSGFGTDWGQQVGSEYFLETLDHPHIWLHEFVSPFGYGQCVLELI